MIRETRIAVLLTVLLSLSLAGAGGPKQAPRSITQPECEARAGHLMKVIQDYEAKGRRVVYDSQDFWKCLGPGVTLNKLARFITLEEWRNPDPVRTGKEVDFYLKVKDFISKAKKGEKLDMAALLRMGVEASADGQGDVNLQIALLTVHNVMRILARPNQWPQEPNPADPAYPVFMELLGRASVGGRSILDTLGVSRKPLNPKWSLETLFHPEKGFFQPQPGAVNPEYNGGCHYYFWIGSMARTTMGTGAIWAGVVGETLGKKPDQEGVIVIDKVVKELLANPTEQGVVEISMFVCGANFGTEAHRQRQTLLAKIPDKPSVCPGKRTGATRLVLQGVNLEVLDPEKRTFVNKAKMETPTSQWVISHSNFGFASRKDGFKLNVAWDDMPLYIDPLSPFVFTVKAQIEGGPRDAQVAFTPVMDMTGWRVKLLDPGDGIAASGVNAYRLSLRGAAAPDKPKLTSGRLHLQVEAVGRGASVKDGQVVGGTGKFFKGERPDEWDGYFLALQINGVAQIAWSYVPEGSPLLKPQSKP